MVRFSASLTAVALLAIALPAAAADPPRAVTPAIAERIDTALRAATGSAKGLTPALSVAIVEDGRIVYARAFGTADLAANAPATPQTRFPIASVTKMVTAVAVMQLVESGRIALDAPLATYLPSAPHAGEVTIRQLLMHTSGLWNYGDEAFNSGRVATPTTPAAIVASLASRPLDSTPGTAFSYSNTGYLLLALVVEAVDHRSLAEYERLHIFTPAGMTATTVGDTAPPARARGYMDATGVAAPEFSYTWTYGDGDIISTASDLARFDIALMDGKLLKPATFAQMQSSAVAAPQFGSGVRYGLGLTLAPGAGMLFVGHHGGVPGFEAEDEMLPQQRFAVVVLSDAFDFHTSIANAAVLRQTIPSLLAAATPAATSAGGVEDPAITAKLRVLFAGLQHGTVDRSSLTAAMNAALTAEALNASAGEFGPLGALQTLAFRSRETDSGYAVYHYTATFASGQTLPLTISIDAAGMIGGLVLS